MTNPLKENVGSVYIYNKDIKGLDREKFLPPIFKSLGSNRKTMIRPLAGFGQAYSISDRNLFFAKTESLYGIWSNT